MEFLTMDADMLMRVLVACILGGIIGLERESLNRPAGFRTHMLVTTGAALCMVLNELFITSNPGMNIDPGRLGAAVIQGIGFLGAGTIIREGNNVSGLTTAASLWTVACVGLTVGAGHYLLAIATTFIVLLILEFFARIEKKIAQNRSRQIFSIETANSPGQIGKIGNVTGLHMCNIENISIEKLNEASSVLVLTLKIPKTFKAPAFIDDVAKLEGIKSITRIDHLN